MLGINLCRWEAAKLRQSGSRPTAVVIKALREEGKHKTHRDRWVELAGFLATVQLPKKWWPGRWPRKVVKQIH
jgi:hypothetical protein